MKTLLALCLLSLNSSTWDRFCQKGPGVPIRTDCKECQDCKRQDLDHDGDCDQTDYGLFQRIDGKMILVFVVDLSVSSASDPVEYVRQELNRRHEGRR